MYTLKHHAEICNCIRPRVFKTKKTLRQFLKRHNWDKKSIDALLERRQLFGWRLENEK